MKRSIGIIAAVVLLVLIGAAGAMRLDDSIAIVRLFGRA